MLKSKMRLLRASALIGAGLMAVSPVSAANVQLGGWNVQIDNTVSAGVSMIMKDPDAQFLPISNGGAADNSVYRSINAAASALDPDDDGAMDVVNAADACDTSYGGYCQEILAVPNFDGSINTDDGRLNFDKGDVFSTPLRLTTEVEAANGPWTAFARLNVWHDVTAMDDNAYNRSASGLTDDGEENAGQDIELLDAYLAYDGDIGDMPFTLRAGRQVINWGEATFIPGGNSAFNPIDVAALRRPGAEIKEALLPVEALYGSIAVTQDVTIEAYVGGWEDFRLEAGGTPNSISDSFVDGTAGGNPQDVYFIGGGYRSGPQFACEGVTPLSVLGAGADGQVDQDVPTAAVNADNANNYLTSVAVIGRILQIPGAVNCATSPNMDAVRTWTTGNAEAERVAAGDTGIVRGVEGEDGDSSMGLAVRWYAENLNSTEFAFYYQKGDSRLPYISYNSKKGDIGASSTSSKSSVVGRGGGPTGCGGFLGVDAITDTAIPALGVPAGLKLYNPAYIGVTVNDSKNILEDAGIQAIANQVAAQLPGYSRSAPATDNIAYLQETNCLLALGQRNTGIDNILTGFDAGGQLHTGATNIGATANLELFAEYPEVETYGFSFNTTVSGWGVQGDFTYRPEAPLQFDTDVLTITGLFNNCLFHTVGVLEQIYITGSTYDHEFGGVGCTDETKYIKGYTTDHDVVTWDIGTTATFTRSNPVVSALRSDLGIFLTEFQGVSVDGIEEDRGNTGTLGAAAGVPAAAVVEGIVPLSNVCQGGSDLPLNGILSIDDRTNGDVRTPTDDNPKGYCRPTDNSWGVVLMAQLQYNNVFGTPVGLKPQIVYSTGISGYSPSPMGFWREGVGSTAFSLTADYLGTWSANLSYRTYHGDKDRTRNTDRDVMSASVTYAF